MYLIFQIQGGIGKSIMATAVVEGLHKKYPKEKIVVVTAYPYVFINNPNIYKCIDFNNLNYFYKDFIEDKESEVFVHDPYLTTDFIYNKKHLIEIWFDLCNLKYENEQPKLFLTQRETSFYQKQFESIDKPILVMQTNGGAQNQAWKYSWARDLPEQVVKDVVATVKNDYTIFHIRREDQPAYADTISVDKSSIREIASMLLLSKKRLFIDSFAQHAAAALNLPSTVCWIANTPRVFGYDLHTNILANKTTTEPELKMSFLHKYNFTGDPMEFPYNDESEIFNTEEIIKSLSEE